MLFDFIFAFAFFGSLAKGYIKGFSRTLFNLIVFIVAVGLSVIVFDSIGNIVLNTDIGNSVSNQISEEINAIGESYKSKPENAPYLSSILELAAGEKGVDLFSISDKIADKTVKTIVIIPIFILIIVLCNVVYYLLKRLINKLPGTSLLGGFDKLLGAVCGLVYGVVIVATLFVVASFLQFIPSQSFLNQQYNSSGIVILINDLIF